jgi:tRNA U38,U39,U40 pseudouridine synthase TruA
MGWEFDAMVRFGLSKNVFYFKVLHPDVENTTEGTILAAMQKVKMIKNIEYARWNRCGRTDKNVSGFRQVGSCIVR